MCGRFTFTAEEHEILKAYGIAPGDSWIEPRYNIAPGQQVVTVVNDGEKNRIGQLKWGLVPVWAKDPSIGYKMINARSETAHEKPSFKRLLERKRCLILADSFYEWKKENGQKQPYRIFPEDRSFFAFAGLWDRFKQGDEELVTCTILTKEANEFMEPIHSRMPVILPREDEAWWMEQKKRDVNELHDYLINLQMDALDAYPVSTYVNHAKNEGPACIESLT
ncbi:MULTISPECIES: SOS response-associated peptidase [Pontibacillus]|uniref:Abasic site processing protein n=1 Tax=Pontibacillus chungwhensis TaxID=265426 RepID=A0ABY8UZH4_9BACI|nr:MULTISPECIES: SOS response-associated peptidase [Pontibacillus]MCD5325465.1 SOS response-associated peptidase [Pontibacillus sp. HN14]WIF98578.1 SOS response-associated peptidase [Pontibacillus chungwhensis]